MTRTERTYYVVVALYCWCWSFIAPVYPLFLLSRGLDVLQINLVLATYLIAAFVFEVPTGAVADLVGRKASFILSCVVRMVAFGLYAFAGSFLDCVAAELIDAIGSTLATGALDAWAVDGMHAEGHRGTTERLFARAQVISRILMIASGLAGGYLAEWGFELPWFGAAIGFAATALVASVLMKEQVAPDLAWSEMHRSLVRQVRDGVGAVRHAPVLLVMCLLTMTAAFGTMPAHMYWQPRMQALTGAGPWLMGWLWAFLNLTTVFGSLLIPRLLGHFSRPSILCIAALWRAVMLALVGIAVGVGPAVTGLLLQEISFGLSEPLLQAWMNEHVTAEQRATVLSVRSMFFTLGGAMGLVCIGLLARGFGIPLAWVASGLVFLLVAPGYLYLGRLAQQAQAVPGGAAPAAAPLRPVC